MALRYPDLGTPPRGWTVARAGASLRLIPPGASARGARAFMAVSPLVPRTPNMPGVEAILRQTLAAETGATGMVVESETAAAAVADGGLEGTRLEVTVRLAAGTTQRRVYTMYRDDAFLYGLHYIADAQTYPVLLAAYDAAVASVLAAEP